MTFFDVNIHPTSSLGAILIPTETQTHWSSTLINNSKDNGSGYSKYTIVVFPQDLCSFVDFIFITVTSVGDDILIPIFL